MNDVRGTVQEYYGRILKTKADLQTSACCCADSPPQHLREVLSGVHPEVSARFYGCGSPIPSCLEGMTVLDLGCGTGRDCFAISKLVGAKGRVIGVDMTESQLAVARGFVDYHTKQYGYSTPNIHFVKGYIEDLESCGIKSDSVDVVISNCVLNLAPDKKRAFAEIFRVLKTGGELYFSDVFSTRRVPENLVQDPLLLGECLGGAMYIEDFRRLLSTLGCPDYRVITESPITEFSPEIRAKIGNIEFKSITVRAFKLPQLEDRCEDFGQVAFYNGTIPESPHSFVLDDHHTFEAGRAFPICGNTAAMLSQSRFSKHFKIVGSGEVHYGLFDCNKAQVSTPKAPGACC